MLSPFTLGALRAPVPAPTGDVGGVIRSMTMEDMLNVSTTVTQARLPQASYALAYRQTLCCFWRVSRHARVSGRDCLFCVTRERPGGGRPNPCYQIRQLDFGHVAAGTSCARPACPSPPICPLPSGAGRNLASKTTKVVIVGWWRVTINDMARWHTAGLSAVAARACARWRRL